MKTADVKSSTYIHFNKFEVGDHVGLPKYKTFLQRVTLKIDLRKILWLKKFRILCRGHVISNLSGEEIVGTFYEKKLQKTIKKGLEWKK